jgi:hypothetical protein
MAAKTEHLIGKLIRHFSRLADKGRRPTYALAALLVIFSAYFSCREAIMPLLAVASFDLPDLDENQIAAPNIMRSQVQKHFLSYGIYIPLSDIVAVSSNQPNDSRLNFLMRKSCGSGMIHAWVPIQFRFPFFGARTYEWCWTLEKPHPKRETQSSPPQKGLL